jgi:colicin import membrane protein
MKIFAAGLVFLILLVIGGSASNSFKYYMTENQGALEIWKGKFAPIGKKLVIALPGVSAPTDMKKTYRSGDVYPLVFQYYIDKADALLDVPGIPDFEGIKATLKTALEYGSTSDLRTVAFQRLDNIDRLILAYKADVAASRGTIDDLNAAIEFLNAADKLTTDQAQSDLIARTIATHEVTIAALEEQLAAEQAAIEAEAETVAAEPVEDVPEATKESMASDVPDTEQH